MKKIVIIVVILFIIGSIVGVFIYKSKSPAAVMSKGSTFTVKKSDLRITLTEEGTLKAKENTPLRANIDRQVTIISIIQAGSSVKKGDLLAEFEKKEFEDELNRATTDLQNAETAVTVNKENLKVQDLSSANDIEKAEREYRFAELSLKSYEELEGPKLIKESELSIEKAQVDIEDAKRELDESTVMLKEDLVTAYQVKTAEIKYKNSQNSLEIAKLSNTILTKFTHPKKLEELKAAWAAAKNSMERTKLTANSNLLQKQAEIKKAESALKQTQIWVDKIKENISKLKIFAPIDGYLIYGDANHSYWGYSREFKVGEKVHGMETLFSIPDMSEMLISFRIDETDVNKLRVDNPVFIKAEAIPNIIFNGKIKTIAKLTTQRYSYGGINNKFDVVSTLIEKDEKLKPGMKINGEIFIEEIKNTLTIPINAVFDKAGKQICYVKSEKGFVEKEVKPGKSNDEFVQILDGLKEGDAVALYNPMVK